MKGFPLLCTRDGDIAGLVKLLLISILTASSTVGSSGACNVTLANFCANPFNFPLALFQGTTLPYTAPQWTEICSNLTIADNCMLNVAGCNESDDFADQWSRTNNPLHYVCGPGRPALFRNLQSISNFTGYLPYDNDHTGGNCGISLSGSAVSCTQLNSYVECLVLDAQARINHDFAALLGQVVRSDILSGTLTFVFNGVSTPVSSNCTINIPSTDNCGVSNCFDCGTYGPGTCDYCVPGYYVTGGNTCTACLSHCYNCVTSGHLGQCDVCDDGYTLSTTGTCTQCSSNCLSCDISKAGLCDQCLNGYMITTGHTCIPCTATNCYVCSTTQPAGQCNICNYGYSLTPAGTCTPTRCNQTEVDICLKPYNFPDTFLLFSPSTGYTASQWSQMCSNLTTATVCINTTAACYDSDLPSYTAHNDYWYRIRDPLQYICTTGSEAYLNNAACFSKFAGVNSGCATPSTAADCSGMNALISCMEQYAAGVCNTFAAGTLYAQILRIQFEEGDVNIDNTSLPWTCSLTDIGSLPSQSLSTIESITSNPQSFQWSSPVSQTTTINSASTATATSSLNTMLIIIIVVVGAVVVLTLLVVIVIVVCGRRRRQRQPPTIANTIPLPIVNNSQPRQGPPGQDYYISPLYDELNPEDALAYYRLQHNTELKKMAVVAGASGDYAALYDAVDNEMFQKEKNSSVENSNKLSVFPPTTKR